MTRLDVLVEGHADSLVLRLVRLAAGNEKTARDHVWLAMQGDPLLRQAIERAGIRKLVRGSLGNYRELVKVAGPFVAAHPGE